MFDAEKNARIESRARRQFNAVRVPLALPVRYS